MSTIHITNITIGRKIQVCLDGGVIVDLVDLLKTVRELGNCGPCDLVFGEKTTALTSPNEQCIFWQILGGLGRTEVFLIHETSHLLIQDLPANTRVPVFEVSLENGDVKKIGSVSAATPTNGIKEVHDFFCKFYSIAHKKILSFIPYVECKGMGRLDISKVTLYTNGLTYTTMDGVELPFSSLGSVKRVAITGTAMRCYDHTAKITASDFCSAFLGNKVNATFSIANFNKKIAAIVVHVEDLILAKEETPKSLQSFRKYFEDLHVFYDNASTHLRTVSFNETSIPLLFGDCDVVAVKAKITEELKNISAVVAKQFAALFAVPTPPPPTVWGTILATSDQPNTFPIAITKKIPFGYFHLRKGYMIVTEHGFHWPLQAWLDEKFGDATEETTGEIKLTILSNPTSTLLCWKENYCKFRSEFLKGNVTPINHHVKNIFSIDNSTSLITIGEALCKLTMDRATVRREYPDFDECVAPFVDARPSFKIIYGTNAEGVSIEAVHKPNSLVTYLYAPAIDKSQRLIGYTKNRVRNLLTQELVEEKIYFTDKVFGEHEELDIDTLRV